MTRPMMLLAVAILASPLAAWGIHRLARGLGFLDPPWNVEHEQRRTIVMALFAFVLFLSVFLFGHANAWPRVWAIFGIINGLALIFFATIGAIAARRLWKLRHATPETTAPAAPLTSDDASPAEKPLA